MRKWTAKSQQVPKKSNIVKKKMKTIEKKNFLSKRGILKVIYFFSFPILCRLFFSDGDHFLFPNGSSLACCACSVPPQPRASSQPGRTRAEGGLLWPRRCPQGALGRGKRQETELGRPSASAQPLWPVTRLAPPTAAADSAGASSSLPCLLPWGTERQAQGVKS